MDSREYKAAKDTWRKGGAMQEVVVTIEVEVEGQVEVHEVKYVTDSQEDKPC